MLTPVDSDGFILTTMEGIIDYRKYAATGIVKDYIYILTKRGQKKIYKTTMGWQLPVQ